MKYGTKFKRTPKYMPDLNMKNLNQSEQNLYKIVNSYVQTQQTIEKIPQMQRPQIYKALAGIYANLAQQMEDKKDMKNEAAIFKILALTYAQNAMKCQEPTVNRLKTYGS